MTPIKASVGFLGQNHKADVLRIQCLLNMVPPWIGGPDPKLKMDGIAGQKTIAAIKKFQNAHFGAAKADGRADPGRRTEMRLNELEGSPDTIPMMHAQAAWEQAAKWAQTARSAVSDLIHPNGTPVPQAGADAVAVANFTSAFNLTLYPGPLVFNTRLATPAELKFLRDKFQQIAALLTSPKQIAYLDSGVLDMYGNLSKEKVHALAPATGAAGEVRINFKFCAWDPVNEFGLGPMTRAAIVFQSAAMNADKNDPRELPVSTMWMQSHLYPPEMAMHGSAWASWFAQMMQTRSISWLATFYHVPGAGPWFDVPGLA